MLKESESRNGGRQLFKSAEYMLNQGHPMTKYSFLRAEGLGGLEVETVMEDLELFIQEEIVPDYFQYLPDEEEYEEEEDEEEMD